MNVRQAMLTVILTGAIGLAPQIAVACPNCKESLNQGAATGYAISIIFMMCMPVVIITFWTVLIWRLRSKMKTGQVTTIQS